MLAIGTGQKAEQKLELLLMRYHNLQRLRVTLNAEIERIKQKILFHQSLSGVTDE